MSPPLDDCTIEHRARHVWVGFARPRHVLSSAVLNGGLVLADHIVNVKVEENFAGARTSFEAPEVTLASYCERQCWRGLAVGMMTSALMDSFRQTRRQSQDTAIVALVTAGVSNARRAGDRADWRHVGEPPGAAGTINIIALTNARLTPAAMVEAVITATEAKSVALDQCGVKSCTSGERATGTGTDAIAVASGFGPKEVRYCGKHVLFGEMLASAVIEAVTSSLAGADCP